MKSQQLIEMPENELNDLLEETKEKLAKLRMGHAISPLENPQQIKFVRKEIARILTEKRRRQLNTEQKNN